MATYIPGPGPSGPSGGGFFSWSLERDNRGYREYKLKFRVISDDPRDGPTTVLLTPGFPLPGSLWFLGHDADPWAWCRWNASVKKVDEDDPGCLHWICELTFSTKPDEYYCRLIQVEDPLLEPVKFSGGTVKYQEEATQDIYGNPVFNSAHEQIRGPQVEFDKNRTGVHLEYNVANLNYPLVNSLVNCVNANVMWGFPPRTVKLSKFDWETKYYGPCQPYYTWKLDFDINQNIDPGTGQILGFDRIVLDEGTKVLNGHWQASTGKWSLDPIGGSPPDPANPQHFIRFKDRNGENTRIILNGAGLPADVNIGTGTGSGESGGPAGTKLLQIYRGVNFFSIGGLPVNL